MIDFDDLINDDEPSAGSNKQASNKPDNRVDDLLEEALREQLGEDDEQQQEKASDTAAEGEGEATKADDQDKDAGKDGPSSGDDSKLQQGQEVKGKGASRPQDLTLPDGTVVKAGAERRFYEQLQLARKQNADLNNTANQLRASNEQLRSRLQAFEQATSYVQGLPVEQVSDAVKLAKALQSDPVGTLRLLLTEAANAGISLNGVVSGLDVDAAVAKVRQEFEPLLEQQRQQQQEQLIEQEAIQTAQQFFSQFPDALVHDGLIAQMLRADPSLELRDAYYQLQSAFIERGLDWNRPLAEQISSANTKPTEQQQQKPTAPMTNGRGISPNVQVGEANRTTVAPADASYNQIIREAMREAGLSTK